MSDVQGGGSEGDEFIACSAKVLLESQWWRNFPASKVFTSIQSAINSLS
jgi:hypothetical protein